MLMTHSTGNLSREQHGQAVRIKERDPPREDRRITNNPQQSKTSYAAPILTVTGGKCPHAKDVRFWNRQTARDWALQTGYPKVFKLSVGVGGRNVVLVRSQKEALGLIDQMFGPGICEDQIGRHPCRGIPRNWHQFRELGHRYKFAFHYAVQGQLRLPENRWRIEKEYA